MIDFRAYLRRPLDEWLVRGITMMCMVTLLVPFITFSGIYFPYIVPRNVFFRICVAVIIIMYALLVMRNRSYLPKMHKPFWLYIGFTLALTIASILGGNMTYSLLGNFERMDGLVTWYALLLLIVVLTGVFRTQERFEPLLWGSLFVSYMIAVVGISQLRGVDLLQASSGGERITSTLGNATYLSAYLLLHVCIAAYVFLRSSRGALTRSVMLLSIPLDIILLGVHVYYGIMQDKVGMVQQIFSDWVVLASFISVQLIAWASIIFKHRFAYQQFADRGIAGILILLYVILISTTQTRGALIGLALGVFVVLVGILVRTGFSRRIRLASLAVLLSGVIIVVGVFVYRDAPLVQGVPILKKIVSISTADATTKSRLATWASALSGFYEKPILGWGAEGFHVVFNKYFPTEIYTDEGTPLWFDRPHNILLQYLVEGGIVGLGLFVAFVVMSIVFAFSRLHRKEALFILGCFTAYIGQNIFVFDSINSYLTFALLIAFFFVLFRGDESPASGSPVPLVSQPFFRVGVWLCVIAVVAGSVWSTSIRPLQANAAFVGYYFQQIESKQGYQPEVTEKVFELFDRAPYQGRQELLGVYSEYAVDRVREQYASRDDLIALVDGLGERFDRERASGYVRDARFNMYQLNLYLNAGFLDQSYYEKVITLTEQSIPLSPDRPQLYYIRGRAYMNMQRYDEGLADFKKAVALAPDVPDAHSNLFAAYATMGDRDNAKKEFAVLRTLMNFDTKTFARFISVYVASGLYDDAIELLKQAQTELPESKLELQVGIAEVYAVAGRNAEARAAMREAVQINPSAASYAEEFYRKLESGELKRGK